MDLLQLREKEIFEALKKIRDLRFAVIGGYAVNAYTLPRFSIDCDIVVKDIGELKKVERKLAEMNYIKTETSKLNIYCSGEFRRYEKKIKKGFKVSVDALIKDVLDRQTNATFSADWIFSNSKARILKGKTIQEALKLMIIDIDALVVMKIVSCRATDIRDVFMMINDIKDKDWIIQEVSKRTDFHNRLSKIKEKISSKQFKDGLQGVYGFIDEGLFNKHKSRVLELGK